MAELYIGVMSGTSLDGIDVVAVSFAPLRLHACLSVDFPTDLRAALLALTQSGDDEIERMGRADVAYAEVVSAAITRLMDEHRLDKTQVVAIGSHGQTIRHRPEAGFSLQIGDPNVIAERTRITVVADFRRRDLAAGGQGAPLVPAFHRAVFQVSDKNRIILNLGGIANISVLPAGQPDTVYGFDTGPANLLIDAWCQLHTGQPFDQDGAWAAQGTVHAELLARLLAHGYFQQSAPKSTGREDFHLAWLNQHLTALNTQIQPVDVQATLTALTAQSVADAIQQTGLNEGELYLCGGGAYNQTLWQVLQQRLPSWTLHSTQQLGLAPTWVEAAAFAWLAKQRIEGQTGNLPRVTGAQGGRVLGAVYSASSVMP